MSLAVENTPTASLEEDRLHSARRLYLVSTFFAASGRNAYYVGAAWIVANSSKDSGAVAVFLGLGSVAEFVASAPAGHLTDRLNRRLLCILCDAARILILLATCAALSFGRADHMLFVSVVLYSVVDRIYLTSVPTLVASLVPAEGLLFFNSLSYIGMQAGNLLAAIAAGLLLDTAPEQVCFLFAVGSFLVSLICMSRVPPLCTAELHRHSHIMGDHRLKPKSSRGVGRLSPVLIVSYALVYAMGMLLSVLASTFVLQELAGTAAGFGALESSWAAGAIGGAAVLTLKNFSKTNGWAILPILILSGLTLAAIYVTQSWLIILVQTTLLGAGHNLARVLIEVEIQRNVPDSELGRAKGKIHLICMCFSLILYSLLALSGKSLAPSTVFLAFGIVMALYAISMCFLNITGGRPLTDRLG
jgi:MFS family permease